MRLRSELTTAACGVNRVGHIVQWSNGYLWVMLFWLLVDSVESGNVGLSKKQVTNRIVTPNASVRETTGDKEITQTRFKGRDGHDAFQSAPSVW